MGTWVALMRYSDQIEAEIAAGAVAHRDARVARLEAGGFTVLHWWVSADPQWDIVFVLEAEPDAAREARFQMTVKGSGDFDHGRLIPVVSPESFDAVALDSASAKGQSS